MPRARCVSLFRIGRNQAVRLPKDMDLPGDGAVMRKENDGLIIEPVHPASLLALVTFRRKYREFFKDRLCMNDLVENDADAHYCRITYRSA